MNNNIHTPDTDQVPDSNGSIGYVHYYSVLIPLTTLCAYVNFLIYEGTKLFCCLISAVSFARRRWTTRRVPEYGTTVKYCSILWSTTTGCWYALLLYILRLNREKTHRVIMLCTIFPYLFIGHQHHAPCTRTVRSQAAHITSHSILLVQQQKQKIEELFSMLNASVKTREQIINYTGCVRVQCDSNQRGQPSQNKQRLRWVYT